MDYIASNDKLIADTAAALKTNQIHEIDKKAEAVVNENRDLNKTINDFKEKMAAAAAKNVMLGIKHIGDINLATAQVDQDAAGMKSMADTMKAQQPNSVVVLASEVDGKITFVAMATKDAVAKGVHCGNIIKEITAIAGGRGGGKPDMAQGGGTESSKIDDALARVDDIIAEQINK